MDRSQAKYIDIDGINAKQGKINEDILSELMGHKFIQKMPPKSTGRHEFGKELHFTFIV